MGGRWGSKERIWPRWKKPTKVTQLKLTTQKSTDNLLKGEIFVRNIYVVND